MSHEISFLSARKINKIEEYHRFFHTKAYIRSKSPLNLSLFRMTDEERGIAGGLMGKTGFKRMDKFLLFKEAWDNLAQEIPLAYFDSIGMEKKVLDLTLELDREEYERIKEIPLFPQHATLRFCAGVYASKPIPPGWKEEEAIDYMRERLEGTRIRFCFNYPDFKTVFVEHDGTLSTVYYPPKLRFTRKHAIPLEDGGGIGMTRVL